MGKTIIMNEEQFRAYMKIMLENAKKAKKPLVK